MKKPFYARSFAYPTLGVLLLVALLALSGCGGSATPEAESSSTSTPEPVATEAATEAPTEAATEAPTEAPTEAAATAEVAATVEVTTTEEMTATEEMTETTDATSSVAAGDARVFFLEPTTDAVVPITFTVVMSYTGVTLAPAADGVADAGHMHIMIDSDFIAAGQGIPKDDLHRHFGDGSTTAELSLAPGDHILRLQFADNNHIALEGDQYQDEIAVTVE